MLQVVPYKQEKNSLLNCNTTAETRCKPRKLLVCNHLRFPLSRNHVLKEIALLATGVRIMDRNFSKCNMCEYDGVHRFITKQGTVSWHELVHKLDTIIPTSLVKLLKFHIKDITFCFLHDYLQKHPEYTKFLDYSFRYQCLIKKVPSATGFIFVLYNDVIKVRFFPKSG